MGRSVSTNLANLLALAACETSSTLDLYLVDGSEVHVTSRNSGGTLGDFDYTNDLRMGKELKQSVLTPPDRTTVTIQNVDKNFGANVTSELLTHAVAVFGRYYEDPQGVLPSVWVELFRGEAFPTNLDESECELEILADLVAAGYCVSNWTLAPPCQVPFKSTECAYAGALTTCNKKRKSPDGCFGRDNEHHFVGMEYPDPVAPSAPTGGSGDSGSGGWGGGGGFTCPRVDQYVLVEGPDGQPKPKLAGKISLRDRIWMPTTETYHDIFSAAIIPDQEIWLIVGDNNACVYASGSHPIIRSDRDETGTPLECMHEGRSMMTIRKGRVEQTTARAVRESGRGDVVCLKMKDGHIYAAGNAPGLLVIAHNSKPPPDEIQVY